MREIHLCVLIGLIAILICESRCAMVQIEIDSIRKRDRELTEQTNAWRSYLEVNNLIGSLK